MHITAALTGNLEKVMADVRDEAARAVTVGTTRATDDLKNRLRQQVLAAFGSQRLANTWRGFTYPKLPTTSLGAAGIREVQLATCDIGQCIAADLDATPSIVERQVRIGQRRSIARAPHILGFLLGDSAPRTCSPNWS